MVSVVPQRLRRAAVASGTGPAGRSYDMDAAFMSFQQHGSGNHAVPARCRRGERGRSSFPAAPWLLRAGYPGGVPDVDYIPLFALLGSQLSDDDVHAIAEELANESKPESAETIRQAIATVTDHPASDADVARVKARLAAGGWPLAKPEHFDPANWP